MSSFSKLLHGVVIGKDKTSESSFLPSSLRRIEARPIRGSDEGNGMAHEERAFDVTI
jgi:hypothetical protein